MCDFHTVGLEMFSKVSRRERETLSKTQLNLEILYNLRISICLDIFSTNRMLCLISNVFVIESVSRKKKALA